MNNDKDIPTKKMKSKLKFKVTKRSASEFGAKAHCFVIARKTWLGFYWDTDSYFFTYESAQTFCDTLNNNKY